MKLSVLGLGVGVRSYDRLKLITIDSDFQQGLERRGHGAGRSSKSSRKGLGDGPGEDGMPLRLE